MNKDVEHIDWAPQQRDRSLSENAAEIAPPDVDCEASRRELRVRLLRYTSTGPLLSGGDVDAEWETADSIGDEAVGGSVATPDQNVVEDLGAALGVTYQDDEELRPGDKEHDRDIHRWELDPASSDDWDSRNRE